MELTEEFVKGITPPSPGKNGKGSQVFYRDSCLTGFALRVSSGGTKSYILERRIRGKVKRITIGRDDDISFMKARARAEMLIHEVEKENVRRIRNAIVVSTHITLGDAYQHYLKSRPALNQKTLSDYSQSVNGILHDWMDTPVKEISPGMIIEKHKAAEHTSPYRSNNAMRLLRAVINHVRWKMMSEDHHAILRDNPVNVLTKGNLWYKNYHRTSQDRLDKSKLKAWWNATLKLKKSTTRDFLHFALISGLSPKIIAGLRYCDFDFENRLVQVRINNEVTSLPINTYLSNSIYKHTQRVFNPDSYVFPGLTKDIPLSDPRTSLKQVSRISGIQFNLKDLFHTYLTLVASTSIDKATMKLLSAIYKNKMHTLTTNEIENVRQAQERVYLSIQFVISM